MSLLDKFRIQPTSASYKPPIDSLFGRTSVAVPEEFQLVEAEPKHSWGGQPVQHSKDLSRILALDRREAPEPGALIEEMSAKFRRDNPNCQCKALGALTCVTKLFHVQAWCLKEAPIAGGILGPIGVGHGKTLLDMLMPMAFSDCKRALLLIPPNLRAQFAREWEIYGQHWRLPNLSGGKHYYEGRPTLTVMAFSELSREKSARAFELIKPDLIIVDEAHNLRNHDAVRTSRFLRYFKSNPTARVVCWSGTLTSRSLRDYAHLSTLSLKDGSPLPNHWPTVEEWGGAIDPQPKQGFPKPIGALHVLCKPGEDVRSGFRRRLVDTLGVVSTEESALGTSLIFSERDPGKTPKEVQEALEKMRGPSGARELNRRGEKEQEIKQNGDWKRPDGDELVDALQVARCARELACGFFYRWRYPRGEPDNLILEWLEARKDWRKELREKLKFRRDLMDSPLLVTKAAIRYHQGYKGELPVWKSQCWPKWNELRKQVIPTTEAVWVSTFLAEDAAKFARENKAIIWYDQSAFGAKVAELAGVPLYGGGDKASAEIILEKGNRSVVASLAAHGTGKNLQAFHTALFGNVPGTGTIWEQAVARIHRPGQTADEVNIWLYRHTQEMEDAFEKARDEAAYIQATMGTQQKLTQGAVTWSRSQSKL